MDENTKTTFFTVAALVAAAVLTTCLWLNRSSNPVLEAEDMIGEQLFDDFDPLSLTGMEIVKYDEDTATPSRFEVAQIDGRWSIPSHSDYPTDAKDQLAKAATSMMGLKVLGVASDSPGDHGLYGVLDPDPETLKPGAVGVGTRIVMKGKARKDLVQKDGEVLLALIIGEKVKDREKLHYVRRMGQDPVYTMEVSTEKLSTNFHDWIEKDLLKLNAWDVTQVRIQDYSVNELEREINQRSDTTLAYDSSGDPKWKQVAGKVFEEQGGKAAWVEASLAEDEELDADKLDDLKSALDDLEIVDVARKPAGLSGDLKAAETFINNREAIASLGRRGFYVARDLDGQPSLFSNEGETRVLMKDGVEYVLRFGAIASGSAEKKPKKEGDSGSTGLNRYIFVMAEFNSEAVPEPKLEPLPEEEKTPATEKKTGTKETKPQDPGDTPPAETDKPNADAAKTDKPNADEAKTDKPNADEAKTGEPKTDEAKDDEAKTGEAKTGQKPDIKAERERIEKENKRKQEEYDEKIEAGKKHVKELNARFADWYYVISDKVYQKIHLGRDQLIKKKEKKKDEKDAGGDKDGKGGDGDRAEPDRGEHGRAEKPAEPAGPLEQFDKLKQEGPDGSE